MHLIILILLSCTCYSVEPDNKIIEFNKSILSWINSENPKDYSFQVDRNDIEKLMKISDKVCNGVKSDGGIDAVMNSMINERGKDHKYARNIFTKEGLNIGDFDIDKLLIGDIFVVRYPQYARQR